MRRLATEEELEFLGGDDFFQPTDLGFVTPTPVAAPAVAPVPMRPAGAPAESYIIDPLQFGFRDIGEGERYQTGLGSVQDYFNLTPLGDLSRFAQTQSQGEGEYTTRYNLPEFQSYLSEQGMELREQSLPGNRAARWVQGPEGVVPGTYQEVDLTDRDFGLASAALTVAAGNVMGPGMGLVNAARAADQGDILGAIASAAPGVGALTGSADLAKTVGQAAQVGRAIEREDPLGLLASGSALLDVKNIAGMPVKDVLNYGKVAQAIANEDPLAALMALGNTPVGKDIKPSTEITNPLSIVSNLYSASQGDPRALLDAIKTIGYEAEARSVDEPPAPKTTDPILSQIIDAFQNADLGSAGVGTQAASTGDDVLSLLGGSKITSGLDPDEILAGSVAEQASDEELLRYILPDYLFDRSTADQRIEITAPPEPIPPALNIEEILSTPIPREDLGISATPADQRIEITAPPEPIPPTLDVEEILRTPIPLEDIGVPATPVDQRVEVVAPRSTPEPIPPTLDAEEILRTPIPLEDIGVPATPVDQRVEVVAPRSTPEPIPPTLDVEEILRTPIPLEDIGVPPTPADQRIEVVAPRGTPAPIPPVLDVDEILRTPIPLEGIGVPATPVLEPLTDGERRFDVKEGELARVEIVAPRGGIEPIPPILDVDEILRTPIPLEDIGVPATPVLDYPPPAPTPAPAPAPAPASPPAAPTPPPAPAPAAKPKDMDWLALLALLGQQGQRVPEPYQVAQITARSPFGSILDDETSQDDLLRILRG